MNTGTAERLWKLQTRTNELILEGKRDSESLVQFLQRFVYGGDITAEVWQEAYQLMGMSSEYEEFAKTNEVKADPSRWVVQAIKGVTCNKAVAALRELGVNVETYGVDLDKEVTANDRDPNRDGSYQVSFAKNVEADPEFAGKSANQLKEQNHKGITLLERLLLELAYFIATGKHLDEKNVTLCSGSRRSDGRVPSVYWNSEDRGVYVGWYRPDHALVHLRSRSVVS